MPDLPRNNSKGFAGRWIRNTLYGYLLGIVAMLAWVFVSEALKLPGSQYFTGLCIGLGVGFMQGRLLKKTSGISMHWMTGSLCGLGLSFVVFDFGRALWSEPPGFNIMGAILAGGFLAGVFQYLVIRKRFQRALHWIWISLAGWVAAAGVVKLSEFVNLPGIPNIVQGLINMVLLFFGAAVALGLVTGSGIRWILQETVHETPPADS